MILLQLLKRQDAPSVQLITNLFCHLLINYFQPSNQVRRFKIQNVYLVTKVNKYRL
uniref:Uncharacterized protein n=1 Tax=Lactiplantibacillus paraplantarum TaxID=60520 RepID=T2KIA5_9LACO|nr:hypothetical protein [Lactiplantibacillus paraplantarum]